MPDQDDLDQFINEGGSDAAVEPDAAAVAEPENETGEDAKISKSDLARLLASADSAATLADQVSTLSEQLTSLQNQRANKVETGGGAGDTPPNLASLTADELFANPGAALEKAIDQYARKYMAPVAERFAGNLAGTTIDSFRKDKKDDPLWAGVEPLFTKQVSGLNKQWLGSLNTDQLSEVLTTAYDAAIGKYVQVERAKTRAKKATNIGAGGGDSSTKGKTLADIDPVAYRWAVENGMSEDDQKELVKEIIASKESD